jgi:hypothetical protein
VVKVTREEGVTRHQANFLLVNLIGAGRSQDLHHSP